MPFHSFLGRCHKIEARQGPQDDSRSQGKGQTAEGRQRQIPGGNHGNATDPRAITHILFVTIIIPFLLKRQFLRWLNSAHIVCSDTCLNIVSNLTGWLNHSKINRTS